MKWQISSNQADHLLGYRNRLRFPPELEADYRSDYIRKAEALIRPNLFVLNAINTNVALGLLDLWALPQSWRATWPIHAVMFGVMLALALLAARSHTPRWILRLRGLSAVAICCGFVAVLAVSRLTEIGFDLYFISLIILMVAIPLMGLPLRYIAVVSSTSCLAYAGVAVVAQHMLASPTGTNLLITQLLVLGEALFASLMGGYFTERGQRRDFLQGRVIEHERAKSEGLLLNILPAAVASRLERGEAVADFYPAASVLFADIVNFTPMSAQMTPAEVVALLNEVFSYMDTLADKYGVEKIKTIGDCYMVAAGVPLTRPDHAQTLARLALELQAHVHECVFLGNRHLALRIGINSGPLIAGITGQKKFSYDLWGDTVNTASRMETSGTSGAVQITRPTYELIRDSFICEGQGMIDVKGKGEMEVWHVTGARA
jgi:adenylate cyclase